MFFHHFNRKILALLTAIIVWVFVNQSITDTKTISNVAIRVVNLPAEKTIFGLLPNGYIAQRVSLTVTGTKDVIQELEPGDLEIQLDATGVEGDEWVVSISKKNIVNLSPNIDLRHHITSVSHPEFVFKLSRLVTEKIPIYIKPPMGDSPEGYEFLDIWPESLTQILSGPEEEILALKMKGLKWSFDLDLITREELDVATKNRKQGAEEVSYMIPDKWKKVSVPFKDQPIQEINDPDAKFLHIDFLKKKLSPLGRHVPIVVYYPLKHIQEMNPSTQKLVASKHVTLIEGVAFFTMPLYVKDVSRLFLDIVKDHLVVVLIAAPKAEREILQWNVELIDTQELEDTYVAYVMAQPSENWSQSSHQKEREELLRKRFRQYIQKLALYTANGEKLHLISTISEGEIQIRAE